MLFGLLVRRQIGRAVQRPGLAGAVVYLEVLAAAQPYRNIGGLCVLGSTARVTASSTDWSDSVVLAPCPKYGVTAWAASPSRVMWAVDQVVSGVRS
jgi:hypothetical protein